MSKNIKIIIAVVVAAIAIIAIIVVIGMMNRTVIGVDKTALTANSVEELASLVDKVYEGATVDLYDTETIKIDLTDDSAVKSYTGLENGNDLEYAVVSEPLINAQAYSLVMAKVKNGVNANQIAEQMADNVNPRKWICVSAEKVYAVNSGDIVFLVMSNEEMTNDIFDSFKKLSGTDEKSYMKIVEEESLPEDTVIPMPE